MRHDFPWIVLTSFTLLLGCGSDDDSDGGNGGSGGTAGGAGSGGGTAGTAGGQGGAAGGQGGSMTGGQGGTAGAGLTGGSGGSAGSAGGGPVDCVTCLSTECGAEVNACAVDPGCSAILTCGQGCGMPADPVCVQDCYDNNAAGQAAFDAVVLCTQTKCANCTM